MVDLGSLYLRWHSHVERLAQQMLADADDADEVTQDVFIAAWQRLSEYDTERGTEWAWLRTMTKTRCLDRLRSRRRRLRAAEESACDDEVPHESGEQFDVRSLLLRLPDMQRVPIELAWLGGFSHREIAAHTGEPLGTVKTRIRLGMARLATFLEPVNALCEADKQPA